MNNKLKHSEKNGPESKDRMRTVGMVCGVAIAASTLAIYRFHDTNTELYKKQIDELRQTVTSEKDRADKAEKELKETKYTPGNGKCEFARGEPQGKWAMVKDKDGKDVILTRKNADGKDENVRSDCGFVGDGIYQSQKSNEGDKASLSYSEIDRLCNESEKPEKPRFDFVDAPEFGTKPIRVRTVAAVIFTKDDKVKNSTNALGEDGVRDTYKPNGDDRTIETARYTHEIWCPNMWGGKRKETAKVETPKADTPKTEVETKVPEEAEPIKPKCKAENVVTNTARGQLAMQMQGNFDKELDNGPVELSVSVNVSPTGSANSSGSVSANGVVTSFPVNFNGVKFTPPGDVSYPCIVPVTATLRKQK